MNNIEKYTSEGDEAVNKALAYAGDIYDDDELGEITLEQGDAYADDDEIDELDESGDLIAVSADDYGDIDDDDVYGDIDDDDPYGDIDDSDPYGDIDEDDDLETGRPSRYRRRRAARRAARAQRKVSRLSRRRTPRTKLGKRIRSRRLARATKKIEENKMLTAIKKAEVSSGKVPRNTQVRFLDVKGGVIKNAAIQSDLKFDLADRELIMAEAYNERPYQTYITTGAPTAGVITFNLDATVLYGVGATLAKIPYVVFKVGGPLLTSVTNSAFNFTCSANDSFGGTIDLGTTTVIATGSNAFNITLVISPWVLVRAVPRPALMALSGTATDFSFAVSGVPADAKGTLILPGRDDKTVNDLMSALRK